MKSKKFISKISKHCFRIKVFAKTNKGKYEINCVNESINILEWKKCIDEN